MKILEGERRLLDAMRRLARDELGPEASAEAVEALALKRYEGPCASSRPETYAERLFRELEAEDCRHDLPDLLS